MGEVVERPLQGPNPFRLVVESWDKSSGAEQWSHVIGEENASVFMSVASDGPDGTSWLYVISQEQIGEQLVQTMWLFSNSGLVSSTQVRETDPQPIAGAYANVIIAGNKILFPWKDEATGQLVFRCFLPA